VTFFIVSIHVLNALFPNLIGYYKGGIFSTSVSISFKNAWITTNLGENIVYVLSLDSIDL